MNTKKANGYLPGPEWHAGYTAGNSSGKDSVMGDMSSGLRSGAAVGGGAGLVYELLRKKTEEEKKQQMGEKIMRYLQRGGQGALMGAGAGASAMALKNAEEANSYYDKEPEKMHVYDASEKVQGITPKVQEEEHGEAKTTECERKETSDKSAHALQASIKNIFRRSKVADMRGAFVGSTNGLTLGGLLGGVGGGLYGAASGAYNAPRGKKLTGAFSGAGRGALRGGLVGAGTGAGIGGVLGAHLPLSEIIEKAKAGTPIGQEALAKRIGNPDLVAALTAGGALGGGLLGDAAATSLEGDDEQDDNNNNIKEARTNVNAFQFGAAVKASKVMTQQKKADVAYPRFIENANTWLQNATAVQPARRINYHNLALMGSGLGALGGAISAPKGKMLKRTLQGAGVGGVMGLGAGLGGQIGANISDQRPGPAGDPAWDKWLRTVLPAGGAFGGAMLGHHLGDKALNDYTDDTETGDYKRKRQEEDELADLRAGLAKISGWQSRK